MDWEVVRNLNLGIGEDEYIVNLANTKFNLVFEIYQPLFGRIFFGVNYWPQVYAAFQTILEEVKDGGDPVQIDVELSQDHKKKLTLSYRKNTVKLTRKQSDSNRSTWASEQDSRGRGGLFRSISIPVGSKNELKQLKTLLDRIELLHAEIKEGKIEQPVFGGYGLYYPDEMEKSDRSLLSFKSLLDDDLFTCFVRLDENKSESDTPAKIARARVAKEAKEKEIVFLEDKRYDDGFIKFDEYELSYDWEIRRDWYGNFNNIAIRYVDRNKTYHAVDFPPPKPGKINAISSKEFKDVNDLIKFLKPNKKKMNAPYFIYSTLGQFARKIEKTRIVLSLQCSQMSPLWPELGSKLGFFAAAWHIDFSHAGTVRRTTQNSAGERGDYYECENFGLFQFNMSGVARFRECLNNQFKTGTIEDPRGNIVPKKRLWV